ncbi:MAG: hypothetical protein M0P70_19260 [Desulfobulbaceae bacterium]|nr:hypothetical protein [Desulfobulbaceae bacterium]
MARSYGPACTARQAKDFHIDSINQVMRENSGILKDILCQFLVGIVCNNLTFFLTIRQEAPLKSA